MRALPNLKLIATFEAVARTRSFSQAAKGLNIQQPAVSRQIAELEAALGAILFQRTRPRLTLTQAGEALLSGVSRGLSQIEAAVQTVSAAGQNAPLVINAALGFTSFHLIPRLAEFRMQHPEIELQLVTRDQNLAFDPQGSDVIILFAADGLPGVRSVEIMQGRMTALCAPGYLREGTLLQPADLAMARLLHMSQNGRSPNTDWAAFFAGTGAEPVAPKPDQVFTSFLICLQAAMNGDGICIGWQDLMDDHIRAGRLTLACDRVVPTDRSYHACVSERARHNPAAAAFLDWIGGAAA